MVSVSSMPHPREVNSQKSEILPAVFEGGFNSQRIEKNLPLVSKYIMPGDDEPNFQDEDANNSTCKALFEKVKNRGPIEQRYSK